MLVKKIKAEIELDRLTDLLADDFLKLVDNLKESMEKAERG